MRITQDCEAVNLGYVHGSVSAEPRSSAAPRMSHIALRRSPIRSRLAFRWCELLENPRRAAAAVFLLALVLGGGFIAANLYYNHGHLVSALDDAYITLQFAKQTGQGHFLYYSDLGPGTGGTTFLHPILLGAIYALGVHGAKLLACAMLLGYLSLAVCAALACVLASELVDTRVGLFAGALVATSGPLLWVAGTGMEHTLFAALVLAALVSYLYESRNGRFVLTPALAAATVLMRAEGLVFAGAVTGAVLYSLRRHHRLKAGAIANALLPIVAIVALASFYYANTGQPITPTAAAKSLTATPVFYPPFALHGAADNLIGTFTSLGGFPSVEGRPQFGGDILGGTGYVVPGTAVLVGLGIAWLAVANRKARLWLTVACLALLGLFVASATDGVALAHHLRTELPLLVPLLVFAGIGIWIPLLAAPRSQLARVATLGVGGLFVVYTLALMPIWALRGAEESAAVREQQVSIGHWLHNNLPPSARVAVNDAGAMAYYGSHPTTDLIGLGSPKLAEPSRNGGGSLFEAMEKLPPNELPAYFAVYPGWPVPAELLKAGVMGEPPIRTFDLTLDQKGLLGGDHVAVYKADWSTVRSSGQPPRAPGQVRYALNVADLASEHTSAYQAHMAQVGQQPTSVLRTQTAAGRRVTDGGREIIGGESFTAHNLTPGKDVIVAGRISAKTAGTVRVVAEGKQVGSWTLQPSSDWREQTFTVPGSLVHGSDLQVRLEPPEPDYAPFPAYTSFHYWFFQPD